MMKYILDKIKYLKENEPVGYAITILVIGVGIGIMLTSMVS